jgi:uncharacterized membrane protein YdjX (TVP38/TMEM64 family)
MMRRRYLGLIVLVIIVLMALTFLPELKQILTDRQAFSQLLDHAGILAPISFLFLNALQIAFTPVPGATVGLFAGYFFGFGFGTLLNVLEVLLGSLLAFTLARLFGKPLVDRFVGPKSAGILAKVTAGKGLWGMALILLLPFTPDDALCFMAGLTPITVARFATLIVLCRTPGILVANLTGAGLLHLNTTQWIAVAIVSLTLVYLGWKKSEQLELWSMRTLERLAPGRSRS